MSTTSTIGTSSRNYSTVAAWLAAFTTGGWIGECYNDSEFTVTATINFSGHATSATDTITLRTAAGQGFKDNAGVQTNALRYNASNGVGIRKTNVYNDVINIAESYVTLQNLQMQHSSGGTNHRCYACATAGLTSVLVDSCILESNLTSDSTLYPYTARSGNIINSLIINRGTNGGGVFFDYASGTPVVANCTLVRTQTAAGTALVASSGNWTVKNCAIFGFTTLNSGGTATSCSNNCSDLAIGFGTSNQASKTFSSQFQNVTDATRDFRAKSGGDILDTGVTDTTNVPGAIDIAGTARPQNSVWDIGCWELVVGGGGTTLSRYYFQQHIARMAA